MDTKHVTVALGAVVISMGVSSAASAKTATFLFNNSLAAQEAGIPSLVSVDPLGGNGFESATVEGQTRPVFKWDGNRTPVAEQAGLLFDSSFLADPTSYTVELVFEFTEDTGSWRRIIDTTGRMADTGFYVEPADRLQVYNDVTGSSNFTTNEFHRLAMTVGNNTVKAYFDGNLELNSPTDKLNIVDPIISLFVDNNLGGPAQSEFADGRIAYLRITDGTLSDEEIADNADDPIGDGTVTPPAAVPLPAAALMFLPAAGIGLFAARRSRRKQD